MIAFRTDANNKISTGHMMRCLTIANAFRRRKETVVFLVPSGEGQGFVADAGYECIRVDDGFGILEIGQVRQIVVARGIDTLFVDSYDATKHYLEELNTVCKVVYFDDFFKEQYNVFGLINYNSYSFLYDYKGRYANQAVRLMLGERFVPLRDEFCTQRVLPRENIRRVLMISGGGDLCNSLENMLAFIVKQKEYIEYEFWVIAGRLNTRIGELQQYEALHQNIRIFRDVSNVASLMTQCDIAVSAASTVLYELCAVGLPCIFYETASDQRLEKVFFEQNNIMPYAGIYTENKERCIETIWSKLKELSSDPKQWDFYHTNMMQVVDGKGSMRICEVVCEDRNEA